MKKEWTCGCGITHHLEPSEAAIYVCRHGCGLRFGATPPPPQVEPAQVDPEVTMPEKEAAPAETADTPKAGDAEAGEVAQAGPPIEETR